MKNIFCSIITIGDELLIGQTIDTNSAWIAQQLNPLGIVVKRRVAVGDVKEDVLQALQDEEIQSDIIIITGGLGPTKDDITKDILCNYFNTSLVINEEVLEEVVAFFEKRKRPLLQTNKDQALVPLGCEVLLNKVGTAPGLLFERNNKFIVALPGVPFEMQYLISTEVIHRLQTKYTTPNFIHRTLITAGEGESFIADQLTDYENKLPPQIKLAYLPKLGTVKLRLTGSDVTGEEIEKYFQELKEILNPIVVADEDMEMEKVIATLCLSKNKTIALAESCTGGHIAALLTSIRGASQFFKGGMVCYSNESKVNFLGVTTIENMDETAVSESVAKELAQAACEKFHTDYALAVVGYLEKNDHDNIVWVAVSNGEECLAKRFKVFLARPKNTVMAINYALNFLRLFIASK